MKQDKRSRTYTRREGNPELLIKGGKQKIVRSTSRERYNRARQSSEVNTLLRKKNTTLCERGVGRDEAVKSITDQFDCKRTEEDEFDDVENQPKDESFHIVHGLHDLVVVRHRRIEC